MGLGLGLELGLGFVVGLGVGVRARASARVRVRVGRVFLSSRMRKIRLYLRRDDEQAADHPEHRHGHNRHAGFECS